MEPKLLILNLVGATAGHIDFLRKLFSSEALVLINSLRVHQKLQPSLRSNPKSQSTHLSLVHESLSSAYVHIFALLDKESLHVFAGRTCNETFCSTFGDSPKKSRSPKPTTDTNLSSKALSKK